jgi:hypothetical protein
MKLSDDLTALVFELQRARTPADKARALARAWRTVRGLSATERRLLVREVGFDGAEDLVEGLAAKSSGAFAPAAVLEALGKLKRNKTLSIQGVLAGLRDPGQRDDFLARGIDLASATFAVEEEVDEAPVMEDPVVYEIPTALPITEVAHREPAAESKQVDAVSAASSAEPAEPKRREISPPPPPEVEPRVEPKADPEPTPQARAALLWDESWQDSPILAPAERRSRGIEGLLADGAGETTGSVLDRLRAVRNEIPGLRNAGVRDVLARLETLPELWARRRALVEFIDAGVPEDAAEVLDLIEDLDRPMDRRWCLAALARRGDLHGDSLERALAMIVSPAARRRVEALASRAG